MPFYIATADATGALIATSALMLQPAPGRVEYADGPAGSILETDDGSVVQQQPNADGRTRAWLWLDYPTNQAGYQRIWPVLEGLRSRYRVAMGLSPYVYLKEDVAKGLRKRVQLTVSASASGFTLTTTGLAAGALVGGSVTLNGQIRGILDNTTTTITVGDAFVGATSGLATITYFAHDWVRVRVLQVSRKLADDQGAIRWGETRLVFVIDDAAAVNPWNDLG